MDVDLIFKIAAIGILVAVLNQVLEPGGKRRAGHDDHPGGAGGGADDGGAGDRRPVHSGQDPVSAVMEPVELMGKAAAVAVTAALCGAVRSGGRAGTGPLLLSLAAGVWILLAAWDGLRGDGPPDGGIGPAGRTGPGVWWSRCSKRSFCRW